MNEPLKFTVLAFKIVVDNTIIVPVILEDSIGEYFSPSSQYFTSQFLLQGSCDRLPVAERSKCAHLVALSFEETYHQDLNDFKKIKSMTLVFHATISWGSVNGIVKGAVSFDICRGCGHCKEVIGVRYINISSYKLNILPEKDW